MSKEPDMHTLHIGSWRFGKRTPLI